MTYQQLDKHEEEQNRIIAEIIELENHFASLCVNLNVNNIEQEHRERRQ